ncbi:uncharacterized protein LOC111067550 [Drosophila obscura]|uniref:uncharacterized protein LOC111067550 n=1 Tax=Drosophila obscura TaxID=7282 RepID=UPI001BB0F85D|nr:uncharacterized protein LOC111067550 [Drosophila obscura]
MSIFEKALTKVVEHMLAQKNIEVEDESLKLLMARKMGDKITDIAKMTSDGGNHAGRTKPGYFDLERTFLRMNIMPEDLRAEVKANAGKPKPKIDLPDPKTSTREHHTAAKPMLGATSSKEMAKHPNIPSFIGPFPGPHSYKETPIIAIIDKDYVEAREQMALKRLNEQNAVNRLHLSRKPTVSLFNEPCSRFDLIDVEPPKRPSYLDALMPRDQTYKTDIYDTKDSITHQALKNPFFMEPKSPGARKTPFHVDLGMPLKKETDPKDIDMDDPYNMDPMIVRNPFSVEPKPSGNEPKDIDMDELFNMKPMAAKNPFVMEPKPAGTAKTPFHVDLGMSREKDNDPNYSDMDELFNMQPMKVNNPFLMEPKPAGTPKTPFHVDLGMTRDGEDIDMDDLFDISKLTKDPNETPKELALGDILEKKTDLNLVKDPPQILNTDEIIEIVDSPETPETTEEETKQNAFKGPLTEQENIAQRKREENVEQASTSGSGKRIREKSHRKSSRSEKKHKKQEKSSKVSKSDLNLEKVSQRFDTADPSKKPKTKGILGI